MNSYQIGVKFHVGWRDGSWPFLLITSNRTHYHATGLAYFASERDAAEMTKMDRLVSLE